MRAQRAVPTVTTLATEEPALGRRRPQRVLDICTEDIFSLSGQPAAKPAAAGIQHIHKQPEQPPRGPFEMAGDMVSGLLGWAVGAAEGAAEKAEEEFPMLVGNVEFWVFTIELGLRSIRWFQFGLVAVYLGFRLIVYALMLLPAFLRIAATYYHDSRIIRRIRFGPNRRNFVDIYCPKEATLAMEGKGPKVPVVVAIMGGAWIMGHRAWNAQLGQRLMDFGVLVVAVDYRNFPLGRVPDMVEDLNRAMGWICANVGNYGGDVGRMMLLGQSAGAHLGAQLLLEHSLQEARAEEDRCSPRRLRPPGGWSTRVFKCFMGVSGPYDLVALEPHLVSRGIYSRILYSLSVNGDLAGCSPTCVLKSAEWRAKAEVAAAHLPPIYLFHGDADKSVPSWSSVQFAEALQEVGVHDVTTDLRPGMTHTYPVIEGPMAGDDLQVEILLPLLLGERGRELYATASRRRIWPQVILDLAARVMPY